MVTQCRSASVVASLSVRDPEDTGRTVAPSSSIRNTFSSCRAMSRSPMYTVQPRPRCAAIVAVATPCWPAPVSATSAVLPSRRASRAWPATLLILWLPVWARSSRLNSTRTPSSADSRGAPLTGVGRPAYSPSRPSSPARKSSSAQAARNSRSSSWHAGTRASGTNRPPNGPNRPAGPGSPMITRSETFITTPPSPGAGWPHLNSRVLEQYQTGWRPGSSRPAKPKAPL